MNERWRGLSDGAIVSSIDLAHWDGMKSHVGVVRVYWPFVIFRVTDERSYNVTHALTGMNVTYTRTIKASIAAIKRLRNTGADWEFRSARSRKAQQAKKLAYGAIEQVRGVA